MVKPLSDLSGFSFDGRAALRAIVEQSHYGDLSQTVASLATFCHPTTVAAVGCRNVFAHAADERLKFAIEAIPNAELRFYDVQVSLRRSKDT